MAAFEQQPLRQSIEQESDSPTFSDVALSRRKPFDLRNVGMKDAHAYIEDVQQYARNATARFSQRQLRVAMAGFGLLVVVLLLWGGAGVRGGGGGGGSKAMMLSTMQEGGVWVKPTGFKIVGIVFYGRPMFVDILDCYLLKNLAVNGGYLDEVHFITHTDKRPDLRWLDGLVATNKNYKRVDIEGDFSSLWREHATEAETMYIKIDDDIVYVDDNAIPRLVHSLLAHPEAYAVASNLINSAVTHWLHYHTDAIHPYLPETTESHDHPDNVWRASSLPKYSNTGPIPDEYNFSFTPPFQNHRWLPMPHTSRNLLKTPIASAIYDGLGPARDSWAMAAQQHYSFLENLEYGQLDRYWAGTRSGIWNTQFQHYSINFMAIWGKTVVARPFYYDDEKAMSEMVPRELGMPFLVDTHAIVSHYAFKKQPELLSTDLLERYRALANERVCGARNQKKKLVDVPETPGPHPLSG